MEKEIIGIIAGIVLLFAYIWYLYNMWWGETRPSRSSWWILSVVWTIILLSSISSDPSTDGWVTMTSRWLSIASIVGTLAVAVSTIWKGSNKKEENWTKYDTYSAVCASIALILYFIFSRPEVSFIFAILADLSGLFPTIQNARDYPEQENLIAWVVTVASCLLGIFAVPEWGLSFASASNWAIPVYLVIMDSIVVFFIARRFFSRNKPN